MGNLLQFHNVSFSYKQAQPVLEQVSFSVAPGEFVSIVGPSGCGKSTLFRLILGLEAADAGTVQTEVKAGYMPQQDALLPWRTALQNAAVPLECQGMTKKLALQAARGYFSAFGLAGCEEKYPQDLSGGMRQRVSFLRTFLTGADLLLLDEPFSALDAITKAGMQEWLHEQQQRLGKTVLFITHDVEEALFLSQRVLVIAEQPIRTLQEVIVPLPVRRERAHLARQDIAQLKKDLLQTLQAGAVL